MKYKILRYCTSFTLALSMIGAVPALALADSATVPVGTGETEACYTLTLTSGASTQTAGYTETTQIGPLTALLPTSYSPGVLGAAVITQTVIPPWVDPAVDVNLNGTNTPAWISTHTSWPGGTGNTEGSASLDQWRLFQEDFTLPAGAVVSSANLSYTADNATDVYLNGSTTPISTTNDTYGAVPGALPQYFASVISTSFTPVVGSNMLNFVVRNWGGDYTSNPTGLLYKAVVNYCVPNTPPPPTTVKVTIDKYIDGVQATAVTASSSSFGMSATWSATNIGSGTGTFALSPTGFNSANPYEAVTADMTSGANYSTNEIVDGVTVGADCASGTPFALTGYSVGDTLAAAASTTPTLTAPALTGITSDKYVIVHNRACVEEPVMPTVHILKYLDGQTATAVSANNYLFPMTATWMTANLSGGATSSGAYVLGNNHGGAPDLYGADTAAMQAPAYYTTSEITSNLDVTSNVIPIDGTCVAGKYRLLGYKSSAVSFADAATQATSTLAPEFTGLMSDRYVIVANESCPATGSLTIQKVTTGGYGTFNFTGDNGIAPFTLTTSSTTNTTGSTTLTNLTPGTYHITEAPQHGWTQTDNECATVNVVAGEPTVCIVTNSKNIRLGEIRGTKYEDKKGNGKLPGWGYPRLSGWTIYLDTDNDGSLDAGEPSTLTDRHGNYRFTGLPAGTYYVRELLESGWMQTYPSSGMYTIVLRTGKISKNNNFGNFRLGSISGMKYDDANANGRKNSGEGGLSGWTIVLQKVGGATATTTTDGSGNYSFINLGPGIYKLSEVMQSGWRQTDHPSKVTVRSGTISNNDDFGNTQKPPRWRGDRHNDDDN